MAMIATNQITLLQSATAALSDFFATRREAADRRRSFNRTFNELSQLTNLELADIGLNRGMITDVSYQAAYGVSPR